MGFRAYGYFEPTTRYAIYLSVDNQCIALILVSWDLIKGTDQAYTSLDADNRAGEVDLIHTPFDRVTRPLDQPADCIKVYLHRMVV